MKSQFQATCPICGQFITAKGETVYRGGLIPKHDARIVGDGYCPVAFGTTSKNGPELMSCTWTPKKHQKKIFKGSWVFTVDLVEDGTVYGIMEYPDGTSEEAEYPLGQWWARCNIDREDVPTFDRAFEMIVRDSLGRAFFAQDEYEAGAIAFSLFRGDISLWKGK